MSNINQEIGSLIVILTFVFVAIIIFVASLILYSQRKIRQKQTESFYDILNAVETEKERVAKDLHDQAGPILSKISMNMEMVSGKLDENDWAKFKIENRQLIDNLIYDLKATSYDLMPRVLQSHQLLIALEDFCEMMARGLKTEIEFSSQGELPDMNKQTELNIYRIVQEIVNNAIKYANASVIHVLAKVTKTHFSIEISDDGKGFDLEKAMNNNSKSIGLKNIHSRVDLLNGDIVCSTTLNKGTLYRIKFQLDKLES
jgi:signal transduction histidine kinase